MKVKVSDKTLDLFKRHQIMNEVESHARFDIELEEYALRIQIEGRLLGDLATNHVIPTAINYQNRLVENVKGLKEIFPDDYMKYAKEQVEIITTISEKISGIKSNVDKMVEERKKANNMEDVEKKAHGIAIKWKPYFEKIRIDCDKLEMMKSMMNCGHWLQYRFHCLSNNYRITLRA
ncbi:MAG: hypothetical protein R2766_09435 [Saprospiraceae bacterium]